MVGETPSSSSKTTPQELFLLKVLSLSGCRSSLPYNETDKSLIFEHLISLTKANPSMRISRAEYMGKRTKILCACGTIPMVYQNVTYHLPVKFWLTELYPRYAPHVYVCPTSDMDVLSKHILECTVSDLALGDVINNILEKLLEERKISLDAYLKIVRLLSRLQFVDRAMSVKVYAALTSMASRAHQ